MYKNYKIPIPEYEWEKETYKEENDPFMKHFDKDGNFIEFPKEENVDELEKSDKLEIRCHFKEGRDG